MATTRYTATIHHHSISRAREIDAGNTLRAAKIAATREFGDDMLDYEIIVAERATGETVARRTIGQRNWR